MSVRLVFIGAAAEAAPATSLRALAGGGAIFVPTDCAVELRELLAATAGVSPAELRELAPADLTGLAVPADQAEPIKPTELAALTGVEAIVCVAGPRGPALARAVLAAVARGELTVATVPSAELFNDLLVAAALASLRRIVAILRLQCPWDREQTAADIIRYTVEEVYELAEAVGRDDVAA